VTQITYSARIIPTIVVGIVGEHAMLTAVILLCSTAVAAHVVAYTRENATTVIRISLGCANPVMCFMNAEGT
jgi:hypothetical protein